MWGRKKPPLMESDATAARVRAERDLERRIDDTTRVRALTAEWRRIREKNNIADAFVQTMRGRRA